VTVGDRDVFVRQLPKRIAAIEEIWARLSTGSWDPRQLEALYDRVQEISEASKALSLFQLNESVFSLEVYLGTFVGTGVQPSAEQVDAISGLVRALDTAARVELAAASEPRHGVVTVFVLGQKGGLTTEIGTALNRIDSDVHFFTDVGTLLQQIDQKPPKVIIADTAMLPQIGPLSAELARLREQTALGIPLLFISDSSALQLRVDALRAGGDGFFISPFDAEAIATQIRELVLPDGRMPYRVLIVEDDPTQAEFAASILRKAGMEVLPVTEPTQVVHHLREFRPDLILMDIYMPEVDGIELTKVIREYPEFIALPIVFLSGEQNTDKQLDALSVGGDDFVAKPIRPKHLQAVVEARIRRARQLQRATGHPAKHDRVTGLFSRQHFIDEIAKLIETSPEDSAVAVLCVQPDGLNRLREQLGVGGIDHLIFELGSAIEARVERTDLAARIDEHRLGILIRRGPSTDLEAIADGLRRQVADHRFSDAAALTVSVGIYAMDGRSRDANGLIRRAVSACDAAARHGGNRTQAYRDGIGAPAMSAAAGDDIGPRIKTALQNGAFVTLYQPMLDLSKRGSETYQIVLRVENAAGDLIGDRALVEAAAAAGVGAELDRWILDRAVDILKQRRESGRRTRIFVHQSAVSALSPELPAWLAGRLGAKRIAGTGLVIDFSLPDLSQDLKTAQANIRALREMDVEVSLSRFPEKEAAFKVLRFLRAGYIKIAQRLLKAERSVISSVIRQAHDAKARVIDDARSIDLHWSSGADFLQGNFIQRPLENMEYDFSQVVI
jgi:diguanylate cyclase (GGDEF)-like protein